MKTALKETTEHLSKYLVFNVGETSYAIGVMNVQEICTQQELVPIADAPDYFLGCLALRQLYIPVIDLGKLFKLSTSTNTAQSVIIVLIPAEKDTKISPLGIVVNSVSDVVSLEQNNILPPPSHLTGSLSHYLTNIAKHADESLLVLDAEKLLALHNKRG